MRRPIALLLALPLALAGTQLAHALAYRLAQPDAHLREHLLAETGHAYLRWLPTAGGLAAAAALVALGLAMAALRREARPGSGPGPTSTPPRLDPARWPYALLPPLAFAAQELLERLGTTGHVGLGALAERTFLYGLALQAPFALAAWLVARLLLRAAAAVALRRATGRPPRARAAAPPRPAPAARLAAPRGSLLALRLAGRGPPLPALS